MQTIQINRNITKESIDNKEKLLNAKYSLLKISSSITGNLEKDLNKMVSIIAENLLVSRVSIWFFNKAGDTLECKTLYSLDSKKYISEIELKESEAPIYFQKIKTEESIVASYAETDANTSEFVESYFKPFNIKSSLDTPIWFNGKISGLLCL